MSSAKREIELTKMWWLFGIVALINWLPMFQLIMQPVPAAGADEVSMMQKRLAPLKPYLPEHGIIGYLSDGEQTKTGMISSVALLDIVSMKRFTLTQFALIPRTVVHSTEPALVVGNFKNPEQGLRLARTQGLSVRRRWDDGVMLLEHVAK